MPSFFSLRELWALPGFVPSALLVLGWLVLMRRLRFSGYGIAFIGLLGTTLHEAAHYMCGLLLGAKPVSVSLFPRRDGDRWILGSVGFANLNIWNAAFVGFAPLLLIGVALFIADYWLLPAFAAGSYVSWVLAGYAVACSLFSCLPSSTDIKVGFLSAVMWGGVAWGIWQLAAPALG